MNFGDFRNLNFSVFGKDSEFKGTFYVSGNVTIAANIEGEIIMQKEGKIILERTGYFKGKIKGHDIEVFGEIDGEIEATGALVVRSSAKISGKMKSARLAIYPGAFINIQGETTEELK
ncbi:MAG: polymer-forming cytoskeletal protein [Bacteriovoracaceae bacterium]|nr:polymer-forming cytoskeletal protein [Bacteriovoracaceae bacterium]